MIVLPNIEFLRAQLKGVLDSMGLAQAEHVLFRVIVDESDAVGPKSNMDEIMVFWRLPKIIDQYFSLDDVCEVLVTGLNEIPLWIQVKRVEATSTFVLSSAKRFRKARVVRDWHNGNSAFPFILRIQETGA